MSDLLELSKLLCKVDTVSTACWLWRGYTRKTGYGAIYKNYIAKAVHRRFYELFKGPIPTGLWVLHSCDVRNCVNPNHLRLGTNVENVADRIKRFRGAVKPQGKCCICGGIVYSVKSDTKRCKKCQVVYKREKQKEWRNSPAGKELIAKGRQRAREKERNKRAGLV